MKVFVCNQTPETDTFNILCQTDFIKWTVIKKAWNLEYDHIIILYYGKTPPVKNGVG